MIRKLLPVLMFFAASVYGQDTPPFFCAPLTGNDDLSEKMVAGISRYLDRETAATVSKRSGYRNPDFSGKEGYDRSVAPSRERLAKIIGAADHHDPRYVMEFITGSETMEKVAESPGFTCYAVRWPVTGGIHGEGLLLQPKGIPVASVVAIPDADQTPEMLAGIAPGLPAERQYARRLAENGCRVIVPVIIDRSGKWSGSQRLNLYTNLPHREWIYRQAFTFGRHIIGYEVQKIVAAVDWLTQQNGNTGRKTGVAGWGEGALIGFYSAALDSRIDAALVSGYFSKRENLWTEPIYRNLSGLLREFGDAEIAGLIVPRRLIIEYSVTPAVDGPPSVTGGTVRVRLSAAPGKITTPSFDDVNGEVLRARKLAGPFGNSVSFINNRGKVTVPVSDEALSVFLSDLQTRFAGLKPPLRNDPVPLKVPDKEERQHRQILELENHIQGLIGESRHIRDDFFWGKLGITTPENWRHDIRRYREYFRDSVTGYITQGKTPMNPRARKIIDDPLWTGYEVTLDVLPDIFAWGYLMLPKDIKPGEKRPVLVVQHGGSGVPSVVVDRKNKTYKGLASILADKGYIVFAPHFPWKAGDNYRNLQRKANPLGLTVFSFIMLHHQRILDWLSAQPWVDAGKIGLYGLSWGGKVAVRIPSLLEGYALTVCSGDFNEWIWKNATTDWPNSYMYAPEYEMFDFNLGMTFNYGEMAAMIAPRAFMVERGHGDGVGIDEWVAFEYSKVKRLYDRLNIPQMTEIEYFNGVHEINAKGTMEFIGRHFGIPGNKNR